LTLSPLSANGMTVRRYDRDRFITSLFAPADHREDLFALYAFNIEIARIRETVREPILGQIRLQWWRDNLDQIMNGRTVGRPVADSLAELLKRRPLPRDRFDRLLDARERDMQEAPPADLDELALYVADSAGGLCALAAQLLGGGDEPTQAAAREVGQAWGLLGLLRAHSYHIKQRRLFLPMSLLAESRLDSEELLSGASPPADLAMQLAALVTEHLLAARRLRRQVRKSALPALLPARLADFYLKSLRRAGYDLVDRSWSAVDSHPIALLIAAIGGHF
jgi:NADH dehydrogenase [ubiquinone] 1 alpha subcomplex assembly factor 6